MGNCYICGKIHNHPYKDRETDSELLLKEVKRLKERNQSLINQLYGIKLLAKKRKNDNSLIIKKNYIREQKLCALEKSYYENHKDTYYSFSTDAQK